MRAGCFRRSAIIGTAVVLLGALLGGCSALRVAYNTGPQLAWWWLDGYLDFSREHASEVKASIERWFEWHRASQLPAYAALLASAQPRVDEPVTPAALCEWNRRIVDGLQPALARAIEHAADLVPGLGDEQLRHLEQRYAKNIDEARSEYLQADRSERRQAAVKRALTRAEQVYGSLDEPQRAVIAEAIAASPFDPQVWIDERRRRQRDTLAVLKQLLAERADRAQRVAALRALAERSQRAPDPVYRAYQQRLTEYQCGWIARLHNAATAAQRQRARNRFRQWEDDLRAVVASVGPQAAGGAPAEAGTPPR